jgi:alkanesulfonate monooxygenase SsuD/methylene tetrahydromethanopterin reductase-like flavin-dependent oxidoreductase (luciferase family)
MRYGLTVPNFGSYADVVAVAELARNAEGAAWDGFFIWDHISPAASEGAPIADPWIALTAIALSTERIRIGTMVTPVARRRPWKLARETVTLDRLSGGRLTLGVGLGFPPEEFNTFDEDADARVRAGKLDEGLEVLAGLWSGAPFRYDGQHYRVKETVFAPVPVQSPRIPIWVAGMWPRHAPFRRAARWDGAFPIHENITPLSPSEVSDIVAYVRSHREGGEPFDLVLSGESSGSGRLAWKESLRSYEEAGATWWLETLTDWRGSFAEMREYARGGPPRAR